MQQFFCNNLDAIYDGFDNGTGVTKRDLSKLELEGFISTTIVQTLGASKANHLSKTTDFFAFGVNSLQAIRIRSICQKELDLNGKTLGQNSKSFSLHRILFPWLILFVFRTVVYENPSIEKYVAILMRLSFISKGALHTADWPGTFGHCDMGRTLPKQTSISMPQC
jgi:hypothetical protein